MLKRDISYFSVTNLTTRVKQGFQRARIPISPENGQPKTGPTGWKLQQNRIGPLFGPWIRLYMANWVYTIPGNFEGKEENTPTCFNDILPYSQKFMEKYRNLRSPYVNTTSQEISAPCTLCWVLFCISFGPLYHIRYSNTDGYAKNKSERMLLELLYVSATFPSLWRRFWDTKSGVCHKDNRAFMVPQARPYACNVNYIKSYFHFGFY